MRILAQAISIVFHPLLILTYMLIVMLVVNPYMFGYNHVSDADTLILMVFLTSALIPMIAILVMKGIGWVRSVQMTDRHERIGPYLVTAVLYLSLYLHLAKTKSFPSPLLIVTLGSVIALFGGFFLNNFRKVSMHAIAIGGFLLFVILLYHSYSTARFILPVPFADNLEIPTNYLLYAAILFAGVVCTARLFLHKHTASEVYIGFLVGVSGMLLANLFLG